MPARRVGSCVDLPAQGVAAHVLEPKNVVSAGFEDPLHPISNVGDPRIVDQKCGGRGSGKASDVVRQLFHSINPESDRGCRPKAEIGQCHEAIRSDLLKGAAPRYSQAAHLSRAISSGSPAVGFAKILPQGARVDCAAAVNRAKLMGRKRIDGVVVMMRRGSLLLSLAVVCALGFPEVAKAELKFCNKTDRKI